MKLGPEVIPDLQVQMETLAVQDFRDHLDLLETMEDRVLQVLQALPALLVMLKMAAHLAIDIPILRGSRDQRDRIQCMETILQRLDRCSRFLI